MPRHARILSPTGYYHVIMRGVNRQEIFFSDEDRIRFIDTIKRYKKQLGIEINAYCLMTNHVHILLKADDKLALFIKKLSSSYVYWFNHKYERSGHLFQARFRSEPIDTEEYMLTATRYILHNPEKAGICKFTDYRWSSFSEFFKPDFCDLDILYHVSGNPICLFDFLYSQSNDKCADITNHHPTTDEEIATIASHLSGVNDYTKISQLDIITRNQILAKLKKNGGSVRQISKITGINRGIVQRS